jgi:protein TonB
MEAAMPSVETALRGTPRQGPGAMAMLSAAVLSLGLHGAALAGAVLLWPASPPVPLPVVAVDLVFPPEPEARQTKTAPAPPSLPDAAPLEPPVREAARPAPAHAPLPVPQAVAAVATQPAAAEPAPAKPAPPAVPAPDQVAPAQQPLPPLPAEKPMRIARAAADALPAPAAPKTPVLAPATPGDRPVATKTAVAGPDAAPSAPARRSPASAPAAAPAPLVPPRYAAAGLANPAPQYPYLARRRGVEGQVVLRVMVGPDGAATSVSVARPSGHRLLDDAASAAIAKWRFEPARRAGLPVAATVDVPVTFRLTGR